MATSYVVQAGDTLTKIAKEFGTTVSNLVSLNNIKDANYIVVGQNLTIDGTATTPSTSTSSKVTIDVFGLQSNTDRTMYVSWTWNGSNTDKYQVMWQYDTGDKVWFIGSDTTATHYEDLKGGQSTYTAPAGALRVRVRVKPISKTRTVNNTTTYYWTAGWSTDKIYSFSDNPPVKPGVPSIAIDKYLLETELSNVNNLNATSIQFQVIKDNLTIFTTSNSTIRENLNYVRFTCYVDAGSEYKVRCRSAKGDLVSEWSDYTSSVTAIPSVPGSITTCKTKTKTSIYLEWEVVPNAKTYEIEYTTDKDYFDGSDNTTTVSGIEGTHYERTGLEPGEEYFFRVRAVNDSGSSAWSEIKSVILGSDPSAPTTWSSTTTVIVGEPLTLYWVHNSEDGSSQTYAELELITNGKTKTEIIKNTEDEEEKDKTSRYVIDTSQFVEGTTLQWRVRTSGVTNSYGDWSIQRTVDVYAPPTLILSMSGLIDDGVSKLGSFPFTITGIPGPNTQSPISYHLSIIAKESYETVDAIGMHKVVSLDEEIYSKYFDISEPLSITISAGDVNLENNVTYLLKCIVSMNSGLTAEATVDFVVSWDDLEYEPNAEIGIDYDTMTASIRPYCEDLYGVYIENVLLSVYRREFDGSYTELAKDIENARNTFITDPHPSLDYARYRIVATTKTTGTVCYYDIPAYPVGEKAVILQWDETWSSFDTTNEEALEQPPWSGSLLRLPYNIDVSDKYSSDVSLIEYIGRKHPVSYYGTQIGESSTWKVDIPKSDKETLYALRRLSVWMGDVYVREPSGSGYWANISVSFSQTHCDVIIPVTLDITRVEGGT